MNVQPKQTVTLNGIDIVETHELKKSKYLCAQFRHGVFFEFRGAEWELLG